MALYPPAVKQLIPPPADGRDPKITARLVILHVAATNATSLHDYFNGPSGGVESHFYVLKDGTVQQYRDTAYQADANMAANDFAISIETQGLAAGTWTDAQLASIKALILWCHEVHGVPLVKCPTWDGSGVGYHTLFEKEWDGRNASCPGPDRIKQFDTVLVPWIAAGGTLGGFLMALTDQQQTDLYNRIMAGDANSPATRGDANTIRKDIGYIRDQILAASDPAKIAAAIPLDIAQQVIDALAAKLATPTT